MLPTRNAVAQALHRGTAMFDLRYALRQLARSPGFAAVALLTLTLGMGANTAFFSVLYGVVLRQPPYPGAERLVTLHNALAGATANGGRLSPAEFRDYRDRQRAFEGIATADLGRMTLTSSGEADAFAERVKVSRVTPELFPILGVAPARGRGTRVGDEPAAIAVVSHELWRSRYGGAEDILQRTIRLNGVDYAIVGVMPPGFGYPEPDMGAWLPIDLSPRGEVDRSDHFLGVVGRLAPAVSTAQARMDLQRIARDLQHDEPGAYPKDPQWSIDLESLRENQFGRMLLPLGVLMAAAASVLLIACVNVAIMSLLRALGRRREISIRFALGATRKDVIRQLVIEAALLCALGACGGIILAQTALAMLKAFAPGDIPRLDTAAIDFPTALFTSVALIVVTVVVGVAPALVAVRMNAAEGSMPTGRSSDSRTSTRLRDTLTVMEIALAASLLISAGLTLRSLHALVNVDLGFATENRFAFKTNLTERSYPDAAHVDHFYDQLTSRLASLPGTVSIGAISYLPLSGEGHSVNAAPAESAVARNGREVTAGWGIVRGRYFETMGIALLRGRVFSSEDRPSSQPVAIVDDVLARQLWTNEAAAVGQPGTIGDRPGCRDAHRHRRRAPRQPHRAGPGVAADGLCASVAGISARNVYRDQDHQPAGTVAPAVRSALASVDPSVPMYFAETVDARYDGAIALPRFTAGLVTAFSTLALVLAGVGIFGVTGYAVAQRTREFGIRLALGAQRRHVAALVLSRVGLLTAIGLAIGRLSAWPWARSCPASCSASNRTIR